MVNFLKRHKILSGVAIAVLLVSVAIFFVLNRLSDKGTYAKVQRGSIVEAIYGIGTVKASRVFQLRVGIASVIERIFVDEGAPVKKGDPLIVLDGPRSYTAPFDGIVTELAFKAGETVFPQAPILTITDFKDRYLVVSLEQQGALRAKPGQVVTLSFESIRDQKFSGTVTSVYSSDDRFLVRIDTNELPNSILPGMTADVSISVKTHQNAIVVPVSAIELGKVYLKRGKYEKPEEQSIQTGIIDGTMAQIVSGNVQEGDFVRIAKEK